MIKFIINKIKRYGFFGAIKQGYIRYSNMFLWSSGLHKYVTIKINNIKYNYEKSSVSRIIYELPNIHEGDVNEIIKYSKAGDTVVDIGANIGTVTLPVAKHIGVSGKVYAIEAHPKTFSFLQKNIELNKLKNVISLNIAVGEKNGLVEFSNKELDDINVVSTNKKNIEGTRKEKEENKNINQNTVTVPMIKLDDLLQDVEKIDVLKIDVEGYEKFILENATETLKKTNVVYAEYFEQNTQNFGYKREEIKNILEANGFVCHLSDLNNHVLDVDNIVAIKK